MMQDRGGGGGGGGGGGMGLKPPDEIMGSSNQERRSVKPQLEQPQKCPRCDSLNTKFCYYNNYSLSQPRYFCKTCRRYWTKGGTLRNVPVGGGCRKGGKRPKRSIPEVNNNPSGISSSIIHGNHHENMFQAPSFGAIRPQFMADPGGGGELKMSGLTPMPSFVHTLGLADFGSIFDPRNSALLHQNPGLHPIPGLRMPPTEGFLNGLDHQWRISGGGDGNGEGSKENLLHLLPNFGSGGGPGPLHANAGGGSNVSTIMKMEQAEQPIYDNNTSGAAASGGGGGFWNNSGGSSSNGAGQPWPDFSGYAPPNSYL